MAIRDYESAVRSCFKEDDIAKVWYDEDDPNKMYVAITENQNWSRNCCILREWFFDYEKFETLPLDVDCERYGVYVFWVKKEAEDHPIQRQRKLLLKI
jgi:hypothetical protein